MTDTTSTPAPIQAAIHGPYEDLAIEGIKLIEKMIDGQTVEQRNHIWQGWIDFWDGLFKTVGLLK